jgi:Mobilization protein NikA
VFCGTQNLVGDRRDGPQTPGRMRSAKEAHMGRPRKSEPRDRRLNLSLTASELESIKRRAEAIGMRPVHFGRAVLLNSTRGPVPKTAGDNSANKLIYNQLIRLGNLLNQMVRHLHSTSDPLPADLEPLLKDIRQIIAKVPR